MQGGEMDTSSGPAEEGTGARVAVVDSAATLQKAWCNAELCLPLDDVVRREVWDGSIPIRLELAKQDVSTFEPPMPFYLQVATTFDSWTCVLQLGYAWFVLPVEVC